MRFLFLVARKGLFRNLPIHENANMEDTLLWRSVLDQIVHDAGSKNPKIKQEAISWVSLTNPDFVTVCDLALLDFNIIHKVFHSKLKRMARENKEVK